MSCATLTGHAVRTYGPYSALLDNGPAKKQKLGKNLQKVGEIWGDPFELSLLRKEDFNFIKPKNSTFDVIQASVGQSHRGHQYPAAFLAVASGLNKHGLNSDHPLSYTHLDIAGSAIENNDFQYGKTTACTLVTLTARYILPHWKN